MADVLLVTSGLGRLRPHFQGLDIEQFLSLSMRVGGKYTRGVIDLEGETCSSDV